MLEGSEIVAYAPLIGAIAVVLVGGISYVSQRVVASRRSTLDFISKTEVGNPEWTPIRRVFLDAVRNNNLLDILEDPDDGKNNEILALLNHFELVAVGIRSKALNKKVYERWYQTGYVKTWNQAAPYVKKLREKRNHLTLFCEFERLAKQWESAVRKRTAVL